MPLSRGIFPPLLGVAEVKDTNMTMVFILMTILAINLIETINCLFDKVTALTARAGRHISSPRVVTCRDAQA